MRTFEFHGPNSHKFWTIEVSGKSFTVTFGKVGTSGRSSRPAS
jgi:predicted DNA-binding WGR domain protein